MLRIDVSLWDIKGMFIPISNVNLIFDIDQPIDFTGSDQAKLYTLDTR